MKATQRNTSGIQYVMTAGDAVLTSANADLEKATVEMLNELKERVYEETGLTAKVEFSESELFDACLDAEDTGRLNMSAAFYFDVLQVIAHFDEDLEVYYYENNQLVDAQGQLERRVEAAGITFTQSDRARTDWSDDEIYACYSAFVFVNVVRAEQFCLVNHNYAHLLNDSSELCEAGCAL